MRSRVGLGRDAAGDSTFGVGRPAWLGRLFNVRNVVRPEMIARQLGQLAHLILRKTDTATTTGE
jgi:hypothetical protein